jgi:hypothetical protein
VIILAVVFSISIILYSQIKIIRSIGDSVIAFYAADSGVEKVMYYDRKWNGEGPPEESSAGKRGLCNLCQACSADNEDCADCEYSGADCDVENCENCAVSFSTTLPVLTGSKTYSVRSSVEQKTPDTQPNVKFSHLVIDSVGSYSSVFGVSAVKRGINLNDWRDESGNSKPQMCDETYTCYATKKYIRQEEEVTVYANINAYGHGLNSVIFKIQGYDGTVSAVNPIFTKTERITQNINGNMGDGTFTLTWSGNTIAAYVVEITACDGKTPTLCATESIIVK